MKFNLSITINLSKHFKPIINYNKYAFDSN